MLDSVSRAAPAVTFALQLLDDVLSLTAFPAQFVASKTEVRFLIRAPFLLALGSKDLSDRGVPRDWFVLASSKAPASP
jgi:hypothetical protein